MDVTTAVEQRKSIRQFTDTPVSDELLVDLATRAARSPSGGNVQPWRIYLLSGSAMPRFLDHISERDIEQAAYDVYPPKLHEPYRTNRFQVGEDMYELLGIARDDKPARLARMAENFNFFGAPAALFCFIDERMGPPQWSDCGMYLQTFMLLAEEQGLATCPQEAWANWEGACQEFFETPDNERLFCGMAIGHADTDAPVNALVSRRMPFEQWGTLVTDSPST